MATDDDSPRRGHQPGKVKFLVCVDDSEDCRVALRFACLRARNTDGHIALLYVIEPADFQHWAAVGRLMEAEKREEALKAVVATSDRSPCDVFRPPCAPTGV